MNLTVNERKYALIAFNTFLCFLSVRDAANKCSDCDAHETGKSQRSCEK